MNLDRTELHVAVAARRFRLGPEFRNAAPTKDLFRSMKLQKSSLFGLLAVLELADRAEGHLSVGEIADKYGISSHHLAKVMRRLTRAGLARSVLGPGGGYEFASNAKRTTMLDIVTLFEPLGSHASSVNDESLSSTSIAIAIDSVRNEIDVLTQATLRSITVSSLLKMAHR